MRKIVLGLGILLVIAMVLPVMAAPAVQKATGGGWYIYPDGTRVTKSFTAQKDESGNVKGQWVVTGITNSQSFHADVTGLTVIGNRAAIGGVVTSVPPQSTIVVGTGLCMVVVDNGQGKGVDQMSYTWHAPLSFCESIMFQEQNDYYGNIQVTLE